MKLRTSMFLGVVVLVLAVLGAAIGTIAIVFDRSTRDRLGKEQERAREVALDLHQDRAALYRQECRVVSEEPRLKAVVATEEIERATVLDAVRTLAATLNANVFLMVDENGALIADAADPEATGGSMTSYPVVAKALADGEQSGVWIDEGKAIAVEGCRLQFGAAVVGALVIGHTIDDAFAQLVAKHTGGAFVVVVDGAPITLPPNGVSAEQFKAVMPTIRDGAKEVSAGDTTWFTQVVPIPGYTGQAKAEYVIMRSIDEALAPGRRIVRMLFVIVGAGALASLLFALVLAGRLAKPIDALVARTKSIAKGNLDPQPVSGPTEVQELGFAMDRMAKEIAESRAQLAEKERLTQEMDIASKIQTSILPKRMKVEGLEIAAKMVTATEVGGDYYDVLATPDGCWIAIGDAAGHGLTAGLVMMMVQTGFGALVRANPTGNPRDLLSSLNGVMYENVHDRLETEKHMTLSLLRFSKSGALVVAGAHMDALVWRAATGTTELLGTPGTFLAIAEDIDFVNQEVTWQLDDGDLLVLLTDGVTEAENTAGKAFEYRGVQDVVEKHAKDDPADIRDELFGALMKHTKALADDATIMVLRYVAPRVA